MNKHYRKAQQNIDDEFYTQYKDVEEELRHYNLKDKVIYCNCDTAQSNFVQYFKNNYPKELYYTGLGEGGAMAG